MGTLDEATAAKIEESMQPMSRLSRIRQAAGLERGTIHPSQTGWDYMRPAGPAGAEVQQAFADELHSAYKAHVQETGAENVTLQELYPKMAERYKEVTGEDYTPEKYAADVHTLAESEVTGSRSRAAMTLTGSVGLARRPTTSLWRRRRAHRRHVPPGATTTTASEVITHETSAGRSRRLRRQFGEVTAIPGSCARMEVFNRVSIPCRPTGVDPA